jgi:hypothetical protein
VQPQQDARVRVGAHRRGTQREWGGMGEGGPVPQVGAHSVQSERATWTAAAWAESVPRAGDAICFTSLSINQRIITVFYFLCFFISRLEAILLACL